MYQAFNLPFSNWWQGSNATSEESGPIPLPSVKCHDVEKSKEREAQTLKHLLKANHANHSILFHGLQFHNHTPHILGSAYILGSTSEHLHEIYDEESKHLEPWREAPGEISKDDWRDFLAKREYQRAFIDFFEDQLVNFGYDWKRLVKHYLFTGPNPLFNNMTSGLGHPLIHLGYAFELDSRIAGIEALAMASCCYNFLHKYQDDPSYGQRKPSYTSSSPLHILERIRADDRFDNLFKERGSGNIGPLFDKREGAVLDHWNAWGLANPKEQFEASQSAAVALLVAARPKGKKYDFFVVHLLTTSHAIRILLPLIPSKYQLGLVRQWWLFTVAVYIAQLRPEIDLSRIEKVPLEGRGWKTVDHAALTSKWSTDAHFVKACRAMKVAAETWGDANDLYLKAALKFVHEFDGWGGFGENSVERLEVEHSQ